MSRSFSRRLLRLLISSVLLSALAACGGPSREIVGKWRTSSDPNSLVWEFADNGLLMIGSTRGRYSFGDSGRIKIETPFEKSVYQVTISRDHMTFRESTGSRLEFDRIK
jgi:hypothetical protein